MNQQLIELMASIDARLARMEEMAAIGMKSILSVKESAIYLGVSEDRVRHLMSQGALSFHKGSSANRSYLAKADLDSFMTGVKHRSDTEIREESERMYLAHLRKQREKRGSVKIV